VPDAVTTPLLASPSAITVMVTDAARRPRLTYAPALDGVRAISVLAIIAYHADAPWLPGGFVAVDVFFAMSGFLITSLLLIERGGNGRISLRKFWARRARRLLPALLVLLAVVSLWAAWWADPVAQERYRADALASLGYVANWRFIFANVSYFDSFTTSSPLRHLWTLAIEEQFYLVWPLVVTFVLARSRRGDRKLLAFTLIGTAVSLVLLAINYQPGDPTRAYFGTDTHAYSLLMGAAAALICSRIGTPRWAAKAGIVALPTLIVFLLALDETAAYNYYGVMFVGAVMAVIVVLASVQPGPVQRVLSWRPLVVIGMASYGLYLWHWPVWTILNDGRLGVDGVAADGLRCGILATLTALSYHLVEMPIRRGALRGWRIRVLAPAAVAGVVVIVIATTVAPPIFTEPVAVPAANSVQPPERGQSPTGPPPKPTLMIVGDSTGGSAFQGFDAVLGQQYHVIPASYLPETEGDVCSLDLDLDATKDAGGKIREGRPEAACDWSAKWPKTVRAYRPKVVVMMFGLWDSRPHRVGGRWLEPGTSDWSAHLANRARCAVTTLSAYGAKVLLLLSPLTVQVPDSWIEAYNRVISGVARADPARAITASVQEIAKRGGVAYRWDGVHYTEEGARAVAEALRGVIDEANASPSPPLPFPPPSCAPGVLT
jgi:peptidoglycan/LPS O-acetylase OafA/YrhL